MVYDLRKQHKHLGFLEQGMLWSAFLWKTVQLM